MEYCHNVLKMHFDSIPFFISQHDEKRNYIYSAYLGLLVPVMGKSRKVVIKIMETTDVHGNFFGYNFKENHPLEGGFPQVSAYVNSQRDSLGKENCILIDAGDIYKDNHVYTIQTSLIPTVHILQVK